MDDYIANKRNICLIVDDRAGNKEDGTKVILSKKRRNWWYWINEFMKIHKGIAKSYTLKKAEGKEAKSYDILALDMDTHEIILLAEMKQDDLTLDMNQLEYELHSVYTPLLAKLYNPRMHLICAPSPDKETNKNRTYDYRVIKRLIGLMNDYPWIRYHVHDNPLLAVQKLDKLIRYPPANIMNTIPIYKPKGRKGFAQSISNLMPSITVECGEFLAPHIHKDITEHELGLLLEAFAGRLQDKKAFDLYMIMQETWYK